MELVYLGMEKDYRYIILDRLNKKDSIDIVKFKNDNKSHENEVYNAIYELANEGLIIQTNQEMIIHISMKGKMYFFEYKKLQNETWISKAKKILFIPMFITALTSTIIAYLGVQDKNENKEEVKKQVLIKKKK
jgi:hypothetical protein